jgi:hypothetical protein
MALDPEKLQELAYTLSNDQRQLLREGLGQGEDIDPDTLIATLSDLGNQQVLRTLAADAGDAGAGDAGVPTTTDAGAGDAGSSHPSPPPEPGLTRW